MSAGWSQRGRCLSPPSARTGLAVLAALAQVTHANVSRIASVQPYLSWEVDVVFTGYAVSLQVAPHASQPLTPCTRPELACPLQAIPVGARHLGRALELTTGCLWNTPRHWNLLSARSSLKRRHSMPCRTRVC